MFGWGKGAGYIKQSADTVYKQLRLLPPCVRQNFGMFNTSNAHYKEPNVKKLYQNGPNVPISVCNK